MPTAWAKNNKGNSVESGKLTIARRSVLDAYFAHAKITVTGAAATNTEAANDKTYTVKPGSGWYRVTADTGKTKEEIMKLNNMSSESLGANQVLIIEKASASSGTSATTHTVGADDTLYGISKKHGVSVEDLKKWNGLKSNVINKGQKLLLAEGKQHIEFEKTSKALLGYELYVVVETENLQDQIIELKWKQGKAEVIVAEHVDLTLQQADAEKTVLNTTVGEFGDQSDYDNKADLENLAVFKVTLGPIAEKDQEAWQKKLKESKHLYTQSYLAVDAHSRNDLDESLIDYLGYAGADDDSDTANHFLNEKDNWLLFFAPCDCGAKLKLTYHCHRYRGSSSSYKYGPVDYGTTNTAKYSGWAKLIGDSKVTAEEKEIIIATTKNEGKLDAVQSYDSEVFSAGAIQKTVNPKGQGEFPRQVRDFKKLFPEKFITLFEDCGWSLGGDTRKPTLYYQSPYDTAAKKITGSELKKLITKGFDSGSYKTKLACVPLQSISKAVKDADFQGLQIVDTQKRLEKVLKIKSSMGTDSYALSAYIKSKLGKATALDHHINRPAYVKKDFTDALKRFLAKHDADVDKQNAAKKEQDKIKKLSRNPADWGAKHSAYEKKILDDYGKTRRMSKSNGVSVAPGRYAHLKKEL